VDGLASRLGVGDRHLRRLFARHLGASPLSLARTQRAHFARKLLDETDLPLSQIAWSAGFRSLRRFNGVMRETFGQTPGSLRRKHGRASPSQQTVCLRLPYKDPLDWSALLAFLRPRAIPGVEQVGDESYRRTVGWGNWSSVLEVSRDGNAPYLEMRLQMPPAGALMSILARVNRLFDLQSDSRRIDHHLCGDAELRPWARGRPGLRVPGAWDPFELAVRAILGQQISVKAASTLTGRLVAALSTRLPGAQQEDGIELSHLFPSPETLAAAKLTSLGMTAGRAAAIRSLCQAIIEGRIRFDGSAPAAEVVAQLEALPGIGCWTAQYIAMRALRDPDAFPASDLALRRALSRDSEPLSPGALARRSEAWRPWRAYAAIHLWMGRT
jgi:AraC family transcriptional regulator of adaptative response / DNA-3-methyladenine glycosylase II